ncbi:putative membrane protein [Arcobacter venerupis]|uniref:Membrane protein n=1 Tax=Arcobacter venerupis TaxID=1054033 RepID=A0AAE7B8T9_9BACT|nr:hypothetical protein [Arcobacter venerupis]QKF66015.1 putative membrane protein [Arcobacter venerupis]RWS49371.1 hypothetical protein CKA56_09935 [Arcobacter venerupis]
MSKQEINRQETEKKTKTAKTLFLKKFFINYFWLSILLIVISILITQQTQNSYLLILSSLFETLGMATFVAALFNFTLETTDFLDNIRELLENIVVKKNFLSNMNTKSKKEVLENILQPSEAEMKKYSNIQDYYNYYANETLSVASKNVRSNYSINIIAKIDKDKQRIVTVGTYSYRLYPSNKGFAPITIGFMLDDNLSTCDLIVNKPNGERKTYKYDDDIKPNFVTREDSKVVEIKIQDECKGFEHLDIELRIKEYGHDHWMSVYFKAEQPTDGFNFILNTEDDIKIKIFNVFDVGHNYHIDKSDHNIHIGCYQWINEGAGIAVIVSAEEDKINKLYDNQKVD